MSRSALQKTLEECSDIPEKGRAEPDYRTAFSPWALGIFGFGLVFYATLLGILMIIGPVGNVFLPLLTLPFSAFGDVLFGSWSIEGNPTPGYMPFVEFCGVLNLGLGCLTYWYLRIMKKTDSA